MGARPTNSPYIPTLPPPSSRSTLLTIFFYRTRDYTLPVSWSVCRSVGLSYFLIQRVFFITAPEQLFVTGWPCICPCFTYLEVFVFHHLQSFSTFKNRFLFLFFKVLGAIVVTQSVSTLRADEKIVSHRL